MRTPWYLYVSYPFKPQHRKLWVILMEETPAIKEVMPSIFAAMWRKELRTWLYWFLAWPFVLLGWVCGAINDALEVVIKPSWFEVREVQEARLLPHYENDKVKMNAAFTEARKKIKDDKDV